MKYSYFIFWTWWIWTFVIRLPILAFVIWCRWRQAQTTFLWRIILCVIFACIIAPTVMQEDDWGNPRLIDIFPAIRMLLMLPYMAAFHGQFQFHDWLMLLWTIFWLSIFPTFVVSMALLGIWSAIIRKKENRLM